MDIEKSARAHAEKLDPNWEMSDSPHKTAGHKAYSEYKAKHSAKHPTPKHKALEKMKTIKF